MLSDAALQRTPLPAAPMSQPHLPNQQLMPMPQPDPRSLQQQINDMRAAMLYHQQHYSAASAQQPGSMQPPMTPVLVGMMQPPLGEHATSSSASQLSGMENSGCIWTSPTC